MEKNSAGKSIVQQGKKRSEANGFGTSTIRSKGNSELANASEVVKKKEGFCTSSVNYSTGYQKECSK
ncbi:unnamed protein product [Dovyalis caffra]|uniref:Uncharacterized protein n=1 Tax=Dovyalis caffra TaxID=77055 RepID=A0AAV1S3K3_9ROSI|nr:unnamed protein product [Dovyalis caffra]